ncbi:MAG: pyruvate ferredoxin oxidoreductase [Planctomycetes bacterium]|nr:pyruvate ferredoxin oxidoreductase [Planctomycetota bacterium]
MAKRVALTGNEAGATALKQVNPDVAAVYPITPQTELMHAFAQFVADGEVDTELVLVESEHSAMSATIGASAAGARAITATSSCGLALMWEVIYVAASMRLPIVMPVVNRALSGPINIHCDHSDTMGARDAGCVHLFSENSQEAYDNVIQAFRIAENKDVLTPVIVTWDGFIISHTMETLEVLDDAQVKAFVGEFKPEYSLLNLEKPITLGALALPGYYYEAKRQQVQALENALQVIPQVAADYAKLSGRQYGLFEEYRLRDAEIAILVLGSTAGTSKVAIDELREQGVKAGLLKLRCFRPFPGQQIREAVKHLKALAVMDRSISFGLGGPVFNEVRSALHGVSLPLAPYVYGLGGREIRVSHIKGVFADLPRVAAEGLADRPVKYLGLREDETLPEQALVAE